MARIIIVESEKSSRERMAQWLAEEKYSVEQFADASTFLEAALATSPEVDVMILAWDLTGSMGGPELLARLAQKGVAFPRLVVSPTANLDVTNRVVALKGRDLLMKPVYRVRLLDAVRQALLDAEKIDPFVKELQDELNARSPAIREAIAKLCTRHQETGDERAPDRRKRHRQGDVCPIAARQDTAVAPQRDKRSGAERSGGTQARRGIPSHQSPGNLANAHRKRAFRVMKRGRLPTPRSSGPASSSWPAGGCCCWTRSAALL